MSNEEAVEMIKKMNNSCMICGDIYAFECKEAKDLAIKALIENNRLNTEIERLKSELEQRVDFPCKIGDTVYVTVPFNKPKRINERTVEGFRLIKGEIFVETNTFSHHLSDFGRIVFLNRSVAELKILEL